MKIHRGINPEAPIEFGIKFVSDISGRISDILDQIFSWKDGAYTLLSQQTYKTIGNEIYVVVYVEDMDNIKHSIYFKITKA